MGRRRAQADRSVPDELPVCASSGSNAEEHIYDHADYAVMWLGSVNDTIPTRRAPLMRSGGLNRPMS